MKLSSILVLMMILIGTAFSTSLTTGTSTNGAALQVSSFQTIPATIYAGTSAQLQLNLLNAGTDPASGTVINYQTPDQSQYSQINIGDIGAGATAVATIPFTVPSNVTSGFFIININLVYFGDATHTATKNTPLSVPVQVLQHEVLTVNTVSVQPSSLQPGDTLTAVLQLNNTGGVINNVQISTSSTSAFSLEGTTEQSVGSIPYGSSKTATVTLVSSSSAAPGKYPIPLEITYEDSLGNTINNTVYIGPISVGESLSSFRIFINPETQSEVGGQTLYDVTVQNTGTSPSSAMIDFPENAVFTPIGGSTLYFDTIEPGANETQTVPVGVGSSTLAGYYNLPIVVTSSGQTYNESFGINVDAAPSLAVSSSTQPSFVSSGTPNVVILAQIANTGNGPIRSVYITTQSTKDIPVIGATNKFIGTLNVDDFAAFQITVNVPPNLAPGDYNIPITVSFKDSTNQPHTISEDVPLTVYSAGEAAMYNGASGSTAGAGAAGFRGRSAGGLFGLGLIPTIAIAIVVLILAYFGYKRFKGGKKPVAAQK